MFLWGITKLDNRKESFLCILGSFLKVKEQNGNIFGDAKISNIFWVCLIFLIFFFSKQKMLGLSQRINKNESTPPHGVPLNPLSDHRF